MKRLKSDDLMVIDRPFCIFVEPGDVDGEGNVEWFAKIAGHELDHLVCGTTPQKAIVEAIDLLNTLTGKCSAMLPDHNFIIKTTLEGREAWECARCGEVAAASVLEEV